MSISNSLYIGIIILVLVGAGLFISNRSKNVEEANIVQEIKSNSSRYVEYSKSVLENAANTRRVLFFYASWCPTCKPTDTDLKLSIDKIPPDVTVIRVNYNDPDTDQEEKDLAKNYGITYQHTFVQIDAQGKEITKWNGGRTEDLLAKIK